MDILFVKSGNKIYQTNAFDLPNYLKEGFDQVDETGKKIIKRATGGKTITIQQYNKALDQIDKLKAEIEKLKKAQKEK